MKPPGHRRHRPARVRHHHLRHRFQFRQTPLDQQRHRPTPHRRRRELVPVAVGPADRHEEIARPYGSRIEIDTGDIRVAAVANHILEIAPEVTEKHR